MDKYSEERKNRLSEKLNAAYNFYLQVKNEKEYQEMFYYDEKEQQMRLIPSVTPEQRIEYIKKLHGNLTAMAWLNYLDASEVLSEFVCTYYNTKNICKKNN